MGMTAPNIAIEGKYNLKFFPPKVPTIKLRIIPTIPKEIERVSSVTAMKSLNMVAI
jgi:hypothetical protein